MTTTVPMSADGPGPDDVNRGLVDRVLADIEAHLSYQAPGDVSAPAEGGVSAGVARDVEAVPDGDGYTARVREWEARVAEADRIRGLPTERVLAREQELAEVDALRRLDTEAHVAGLRAASDRAWAELQAQAMSAAARRRVDADVDVRALALSRKRRSRTAIVWVVLGLAMAYTCVNVQEFAAHGTDWTSPLWWVAWGVDPLLSALVVALLLTRGDVATYGQHPAAAASQARWWRRGGVTTLVELGALGAVLVMNVAPELSRHDGARWQLVVLHIVVPLAAVAAALVLPVIQRHYAAAITTLYAAAPDGTAHSGATEAPTSLGYRANSSPPVPAPGRSVAELADQARVLIAAGRLEPDPSASQLRTLFRCATTTASRVRDELRRSAA